MNIKGTPTNPGEMRTSVSIQSRTITTDTGGAQKPSWSTVATVWARWENAHGNEALSSDTIQSEQRARVMIRYRSGVDTTYALLKGSTRYAILSVDNVRERNEYLELIVRAIKAG